jgi:hypothetical protein
MRLLLLHDLLSDELEFAKYLDSLPEQPRWHLIGENWYKIFISIAFYGFLENRDYEELQDPNGLLCFRAFDEKRTPDDLAVVKFILGMAHYFGIGYRHLGRVYGLLKNKYAIVLYSCLMICLFL